MEATITLTPLGCAHDNVVRVFILTPRKMHIDVGRASRNTTKGLSAGKFNAWFDSPIMSREHARIVLEPTGLKLALIQDNGSTHGTFIKGHRLEAKVYTEVNDGDIITFGTQVTAGELSHKPRDFRVGLEWRPWLDPSVNRPAQRESQNVFRIPNYDSESSGEDRSGENSLEITNICKRPAYSIPSSIDDSDSDDFEDQDLDNNLITNVTEPGHHQTLDKPTSRTSGTVIENPVTIVNPQESVQISKYDGPPGSSENYPIDVEDADRMEDAERESDVLEDESTSEDDEGPEILPIGQSNILSSLANPNLSDISFTPVNSASSNESQCVQFGPKIDIQTSAKEPVSWPAFATPHAKNGHCSAFRASEPSVHRWSSHTIGPNDLPIPHPSRYEEGPFSSAYENRFIPEVLRRPCDFGERNQLQYNFHPLTHQHTNQMAGLTLGNLALENSGLHGRSKYEDTGLRVSTAIENIDISAPQAQSKVLDARTDYLLRGDSPTWKYSSYTERAWTPDETENPKGSNLKISDLVHSYTDSTRGLKRKACEMTTSIEARISTSSPDSTGSHINDSTILQSAQAQCLPTDLLESNSGTCSMEIPHNVLQESEDLVPDVVESPATKKIKISSTTTRRSGKFVSGILVGVAGTVAAAVTALISSASADVWQEALHEATHSF